MMRVALFAVAMMCLAGCGESQDVAAPAEHTQTLSMGSGPAMSLPTLIDESVISGIPGETDCIFCGRETGFLTAPELRADVRAKAVYLSWSEVEGADFYTVHGVQYADSEAVGSYTWRTNDRQMFVELESGYHYTFHVYAWSDEPKLRSRASESASFDL
jgi:hypothetical protein